MKYLSVCSGIEAASVAWHPLGWEPLAFSEIEAFPRAVLAHHYPDVPCHGDFTVLRDQPWIVDADILVGGTPCQAFSVAGLRNSLADERGNLSLEYVRLADAIDDVRRADGRDPAIIVWENVPGVLSVKDNAFGCFLAALAGDVDPYVPPRGKWTNAGVVDGPKRTVAWRVLDAQYFGLAQRRRRVFVVASAREGFDPAAVLFEFEGLRRDTPPRREAGKDAAHSTAPCLTSSGRGVERTGDPRGQDPVVGMEIGSHWDGVEHPHPTLNQSAKGSGGVGASNQELFSQRGEYLVGAPEVVGTLDTECGGGKLTHQSLANRHVTGTITARMFGALGTRDVEEGAILPCYLDPLNQDTSTDVAKTLAARSDMDGAGVVLSNDPAHAICANEQRTYTNEGSMFQLRNVVAQPIEVTHSLRAEGFDASEDGTGRGTPLVPIAFSAKDHGADATEELSPTLRAMPHNESHPNGGGQMAVAVPLLEVVAAQMAARRLTPVECERLQGFPDGYTMIPWKKKPAEDCPDGPRYKALGNSMAVPCMRWIGTRIARHLRGEI